MESVNKSGFKLKFKEWIGMISAGEEDWMVFQEGRKLSNVTMISKYTV